MEELSSPPEYIKKKTIIFSLIILVLLILLAFYEKNSNDHSNISTSLETYDSSQNEIAFEKTFTEWLDNSLNQQQPESIIAYSFNLDSPFGLKNVKYSVELIGSNLFDIKNSDWACSEDWVPPKRSINIPLSFSTDNWEECQKKIKSLISGYMTKDGKFKNKLNNVKGIGVGFVDGDLEIINQPNENAARDASHP